MVVESNIKILLVVCPICKRKLLLDLEKNIPAELSSPLYENYKSYRHIFLNSATGMYIEHRFVLIITRDAYIRYPDPNLGKVFEHKQPPARDFTCLKLAPLLDPEFRQCVKTFYNIDDTTLDTLPEKTQIQLPELLVLAGHELTPITITEFLQITDGKPRALVVKVIGVTSRREESSGDFTGVSQRVLTRDVTGYLELTIYTTTPLQIGQIIHIAYLKRYQKDGITKTVLDRRMGQICLLPFVTPNTTVKSPPQLAPHTITVQHLQPHMYYTLKGILKTRSSLRTYQQGINQKFIPILDIVLADSSHQLTVSVKGDPASQIHTKVQLNDIVILTYCQFFIRHGLVVATTTAYSSLSYSQQKLPISSTTLHVLKLSLSNTTLVDLAQTNALGTITGWITKPQLSHDEKRCLLAIVDSSMAACIKLSVNWFKKLAQALPSDIQLVTLTGVLHTRDYTFHLDEQEWKLSPSVSLIKPYFITQTALDTFHGMFCVFGLVEKKYPLQKYKSGQGSFLKVQFKIFYRPFYLLAHTDKDKALLQALTEGALYELFFVRKTHYQNSQQLEFTPFTFFLALSLPKGRKLSSPVPLSNASLFSTFVPSKIKPLTALEMKNSGL